MSQSITPFATFSHTVRIQLIKALQVSPMTVTDMAELVELSMPEVTRHLGKLVEHKFVTKSPTTRKYEITTFGRTSLNLFRPLDFMFTHLEFFQSHDITHLPKEISSKLHFLSDEEYVDGVGSAMIKMQQLVEGTKEKLDIMVDQPFPFGKPNLHIKFILPQSFLEQNPKLKPEGPMKSVDIRIHPSIPVSIAISDDKVALIFFQNTEALDYNSGFYCTTPQGLKFAQQLWGHYWQSGKIPEMLQ